MIRLEQPDEKSQGLPDNEKPDVVELCDANRRATIAICVSVLALIATALTGGGQWYEERAP